MDAAKDNLMNNMTKFQIATKAGHRATEHLFCWMSLIQLSEKKGEALFLCFFDICKYFDKECVQDILSELYSLQVLSKRKTV